MKQRVDNIQHKNNIRHHAALALSGGVDSAVAAYLLREKGYAVTCYFMQCWDNGEDGCRVDSDYQVALSVASYLGLPLYKLDFRTEYRNKVFESMLRSIEKGETPNPDVLCNSEIKFKVFVDYVTSKHPESFIATGHYASVIDLSTAVNYGVYNIPMLTVGRPYDLAKDQSYYLSRIINLTNMSKILFPLSGYMKVDVRTLASKINLPNKERPDSQGLCFIGDVNYREFISKYVKGTPGEVIDIGGKVIGRHKGLEYYTIGQRHGFDVNRYTGAPLYIVGKNTHSNTLIVGEKASCYSSSLTLRDFEVLKGVDVNELQTISSAIKVRIRSLGELASIDSLGIEDDGLRIALKQPIFAPAQGQYAVLYLKDGIIGSGIIS